MKFFDFNNIYSKLSRHLHDRDNDFYTIEALKSLLHDNPWINVMHDGDKDIREIAKSGDVEVLKILFDHFYYRQLNEVKDNPEKQKALLTKMNEYLKEIIFDEINITEEVWDMLHKAKDGEWGNEESELDPEENEDARSTTDETSEDGKKSDHQQCVVPELFGGLGAAPPEQANAHKAEEMDVSGALPEIPE